MICYQTLYGDDIDGNRGIMVWNYKLEPDDREYIRDYVIENMPEYFDGDGACVTDITFINPYTEEEVDIEVDLKEWL
jgi:hypothetical protein